MLFMGLVLYFEAYAQQNVNSCASDRPTLIFTDLVLVLEPNASAM